LRRRLVRRYHRRWLLVTVVTAVAVAGATGFLATGAATRVLRATGITPVAGLVCPPASSASPAACSLTTLPPGPSVAPRTGTSSPAAHPTGKAGHPEASSATKVQPVLAPQSVVRRMLRLINRARVKAGLPGYTLTAGLAASAARHDIRMASGCGLSQQCPGEPPLGARETAAGVDWAIAGENTGEGGPVAGSLPAIVKVGTVVTQDMLAEQPPSDGHLRNLLSTTFHHIGIAICWNAAGTVWVTEDFSN
jgi:uncharacterized protein YkwD